MQTIDEVKEHCRFVGEGIANMVADGERNRGENGEARQVQRGATCRHSESAGVMS